MNLGSLVVVIAECILVCSYGFGSMASDSKNVTSRSSSIDKRVFIGKLKRNFEYANSTKLLKSREVSYKKKFNDASKIDVYTARDRRSPASGGNALSINNLQKRKPQNLRHNTRPTPKPRPGFLWTIAKATYDTFNDTRSAFRQISQLVSDNFATEPPPKKPARPGQHGKPHHVVASSSATASASGSARIPSDPIKTASTTSKPTTTTAEPEYKLTVPEFRNIVLRNIKGLVRLFRIEWSEAMSESGKTLKEFRKDLGNQIGFHLQNNPQNY